MEHGFPVSHCRAFSWYHTHCWETLVKWFKFQTEVCASHPFISVYTEVRSEIKKNHLNLVLRHLANQSKSDFKKKTWVPRIHGKELRELLLPSLLTKCGLHKLTTMQDPNAPTYSKHVEERSITLSFSIPTLCLKGSYPLWRVPFLKEACKGEKKKFYVRGGHRLNFRFWSTSFQQNSFWVKSLAWVLVFLTWGTPETSKAMFHDETCNLPVAALGRWRQYSPIERMSNLHGAWKMLSL